MDSPVLVLALVIALLFAFTVESQGIPDRQPAESPSPPASPVFPRWPPPPPPHYRRKPPAATDRNLSPPKKRKTNRGKKIGLMFVGAASLLQVCIVAFLLFSRRQLFKAQNGYQRN